MHCTSVMHRLISYLTVVQIFNNTSRLCSLSFLFSVHSFPGVCPYVDVNLQMYVYTLYYFNSEACFCNWCLFFPYWLLNTSLYFLIDFLQSFNFYVTFALPLKVILLLGLAMSVHCFLLWVLALNLSKGLPALSSFSVFLFSLSQWIWRFWKNKLLSVICRQQFWYLGIQNLQVCVAFCYSFSLDWEEAVAKSACPGPSNCSASFGSTGREVRKKSREEGQDHLLTTREIQQAIPKLESCFNRKYFATWGKSLWTTVGFKGWRIQEYNSFFHSGKKNKIVFCLFPLFFIGLFN